MAASGFSAPRSMAAHGSAMWRAATGLPFSTPRHRPSDAVVFFAGNGSMLHVAIDRTIRGGRERATKARCLARHRKGCNSHAPAGGFASEVCFQETAKAELYRRHAAQSRPLASADEMSAHGGKADASKRAANDLKPPLGLRADLARMQRAETSPLLPIRCQRKATSRFAGLLALLNI